MLDKGMQHDTLNIIEAIYRPIEGKRVRNAKTGNALLNQVAHLSDRCAGPGPKGYQTDEVLP